jgi:uncharacterized Fe-S cluster-containing protein
MTSKRATEILASLPGKDCGQCGFPTCARFAEHVAWFPVAIERCIHLAAKPSSVVVPGAAVSDTAAVGVGVAALGIDAAGARVTPSFAAPGITPGSWHDMLGREFDFVLEQFPDDPGPRETILPFNPANVERLGIARGDVLRGRPAGVGCPVTHVGRIVEEPDTFNGLLVWCVVGPLVARASAADIGIYTPIAYEGLVNVTRVEIMIGRRYYFLPETCMLQSRHSGVATAVARRGKAVRVRLEGIWIA